MLSACVEVNIPFQDVDMFSIVWHGNYPRYLELARCELLEQIGYNYIDMQASGFLFPIVDLHIRYVKPIEFKQNIQVLATLREWQNWILIEYRITDCHSGERLTKATTRQVAVSLDTRTMLDECPPVFHAKVQQALAGSD